MEGVDNPLQEETRISSPALNSRFFGLKFHADTYIAMEGYLRFPSDSLSWFVVTFVEAKSFNSTKPPNHTTP